MGKNILQFLKIVGQLKRTKRTGWVLRGVKDPESVSDHMYRMSIMALVFEDPTNTLDKERCMKLSLVHDMAECIVGDIAPCDNVPKVEKQKLELDAMEKLCALLDKDTGIEIMELFQEYEHQHTKEAKYVKDLDRFDMVLQAHQYEEEVGKPGWLQEFFDSVDGKIQNKEVEHLYCDLKKQRHLLNQDMEGTK